MFSHDHSRRVGCPVPGCKYKDPIDQIAYALADNHAWFCKHCGQPEGERHGKKCVFNPTNIAQDGHYYRTHAQTESLDAHLQSDCSPSCPQWPSVPKVASGAPHTHGGTDAPECTTCKGQPGYTGIKVGDVTPIIDGASISTGTGTVINSDGMTGPLVESAPDMVNHPPHYNGPVPGIECIDVTRHFSLLRGTAMKYLWRADYKGSKVEDLKKAIWYIQKELETLEDW